MQSIQEEIDFILKIITHPAGYDVDLFGIMCARPTDQGVWCVSWDDDTDEATEICFKKPEDAAKFFVERRRTLQLGIDFEIKAFKELERD